VRLKSIFYIEGNELTDLSRLKFDEKIFMIEQIERSKILDDKEPLF